MIHAPPPLRVARTSAGAARLSIDPRPSTRTSTAGQSSPGKRRAETEADGYRETTSATVEEPEHLGELQLFENMEGDRRDFLQMLSENGRLGDELECLAILASTRRGVEMYFKWQRGWERAST